MIDKEAFLNACTPEEVICLPEVGDVRVRGLTRSEALSLSKLKDDPQALEQTIVRLGLVEPALTAPEVQTWFETAPAGLIDPIISAVERLSAMTGESPKSALPGV